MITPFYEDDFVTLYHADCMDVLSSLPPADAFLDLVEQVSPGPYAELFARRARLGWSYPIGDQALGGETA